MITNARLEFLLEASRKHCCLHGCRVCEDRAIYQELLTLRLAIQHNATIAVPQKMTLQSHAPALE